MATEMASRKHVHHIAPLVGLFLFVGALWLLHHELKEYHYQQVVQHVRELPTDKVLLAVLLTGLSYWILTIYDTIALRYIRHSLSYGRTVLASFLGYVFSHNIGLSFLGASAARYHLYSLWGISGLEVASIVVFCGLTFWIGFCTVAGLVFSFAPLPVPAALHLPFATVRPLGVICLALVVAYLLGAALRRKPIQLRGWEFRWPSLPLSLAQVAISCTDWLVASSVFYVLLPWAPGLSLVTVLGIFTLAQMVGMISHVPGGVGVFETLAVLMLSPFLPPPVVLGTLLIYRLVYYILPLVAGLVTLAVFEVLRRRARLEGIWPVLTRWLPAVVPNAFAVAIVIGGAVLLISGATPSAGHRLPRWRWGI